MRRILARSLMAALMLAAWSGPAGAVDDKNKKQTDSGTVLKTEGGLQFQLPPDWPVEKRGGIVSPIPVEEYLSKKFAALDSRLQELEKQISGFDLRLRVIEEQAKKEQHLKSVEHP